MQIIKILKVKIWFLS